MKIFNRSDLPIDEALWRRVTELLGIEEQRARMLTGKVTEVTVIVDVRKDRDDGHDSPYGRHTPSKIMIFPCRDCTGGTVLTTFLHEMMLEWISCYRPKLYSQGWTEGLCDAVAQSVFQLLGGKMAGKRGCHRFRIDLPVEPIDEQSEVARLLTGMAKLTPDELRHFGGDQTV